MTLPDILQLVSVGCAIIAAGCAVLAARRAGRWRDSDAAQALLRRIEKVEGRSDLHEQRLNAIEEEIDALPTKADIARVEGAIERTCAIADRTEGAVIRLQEFLMQGRGS